jgi:hypothetical protein
MPKRKAPIPVYFTSLEIENVRCFGDRQRLDLTDGNGRPARWTLILGENGVGKTTLLQCLAWMRLVPPPFHPELLWEDDEFLEGLLRKGSNLKLGLEAKLSLGAALSSTEGNAAAAAEPGTIIGIGVQISFDAKGHLSGQVPKNEMDPDTEFPDPLFVAYGANRQRGMQNLDNPDLEDAIAPRRLSKLTELYDLEELLIMLDHNSRVKRRKSREHKQLDRLRKVLVSILPGDNFKPTALEIFPPDVLASGGPSGVNLRTFSGLVPLSALSLGYQTTLALAVDLAWRLLKHHPESPDPLAEPAVVLIDEIDLHLHPLWQLTVIDDLSALFPNTQFVATSHSPLMVQVAETANLALLHQRETDVEIVNEPEVVRSWRVDQILTSELFGVPGARNKQTEALFTRRDELAMKPSLSTEEEAELERLRLRISELPTAQDPEDQKAMDLIRKAAALLKAHKVVES